jgi:small subunit ribosomal protein S15
MSRIHSKRKGKSASTKVYYDKKPDWIPLKESEITDMIVKLSKEGKSTAEIGLILRDQHGVPGAYIATGMRMTKLLKKNSVTFPIPEDLRFLIKRALKLESHIKTNPKDLHNKRSLFLIESKIRRLSKYYVRNDKLPDTWKYTLADAKLLVE